MDDDMSACRMTTAEQAGEPRRRRADATLPAGSLPTLQRNALRKIFDRPEFSPAEVAELGYRRLQQADGIGNKGLAAIADWLHYHGYALKRPETPPPNPNVPRKSRRSIELAVRLLRTHGYIIQDTAGHSVEPKAS